MRISTCSACGLIGHRAAVARNGRVLAEGHVRPLGYTAAAISDVEQIAQDRGYQVAGEQE